RPRTPKTGRGSSDRSLLDKRSSPASARRRRRSARRRGTEAPPDEGWSSAQDRGDLGPRLVQLRDLLARERSARHERMAATPVAFAQLGEIVGASLASEPWIEADR